MRSPGRRRRRRRSQGSRGGVLALTPDRLWFLATDGDDRSWELLSLEPRVSGSWLDRGLEPVPGAKLVVWAPERWVALIAERRDWEQQATTL